MHPRIRTPQMLTSAAMPAMLDASPSSKRLLSSARRSSPPRWPPMRAVGIPSMTADTSTSPSVAKELLDAGALTQDEYSAKRDELLEHV